MAKLKKEEKYIIAGAVTAIAAGVAFLLWKKGAGPPPPPGCIQPDSSLSFPVTITSPSQGAQFEPGSLITISATVQNTYDKCYTLWMGCSLMDPTGKWIDLPLQKKSLQANTTQTVTWTYRVQTTGSWSVVSAAWDVEPTVNCEAQGTCHRLGQDTVNFTVKTSFVGARIIDAIADPRFFRNLSCPWELDLRPYTDVYITVMSTAGKRYTFGIGASFIYEPNRNIILDVPCGNLTLDPGQERTIVLRYNAHLNDPIGWYDLIVRVWMEQCPLFKEPSIDTVIVPRGIFITCG